MRYRPDTISSHESSQFLEATLEMAPDKNARMSGSAYKSGSNIRAFGTTIAKRHVRAAGNVGCKCKSQIQAVLSVGWTWPVQQAAGRGHWIR